MLHMPAIVVVLLTVLGSPTIGASSIGPPPAILPTPTERQLNWHRRGMYAFVHFNINTFTDVEWGSGKEDPKLFNPKKIDTDQWCRIFREAGMTGVIITAKHHDGFCLWPSSLTDHSVKSSPWKLGTGDVLKELSDSCRTHDLDFGIYLSPWDRHNPLYGTGEQYNEYFAQQLREVLTQYGPIFEVWFDGACGEGPNGRRQEYDFKLFQDVVRELQPNACIFSDAGPDIRWIGNEQGLAGETNWSMLRRSEFYPGIPDKNEELLTGHANGTHWVPGEADVSIRPSWYYHPNEDDRVKSLKELMEIWYASIGRNANLLLNVPVSRNGIIHENDALALQNFSQAIESVSGEDLAIGRQATSEQLRGDDPTFAPQNVVDGNPNTYWATNDGVSNASIEIRLDGPTPINHVDLAEYLPLGQRIRSFSIQARTVDGWTPVAKGTTVGNRRIITFRTVMANRIRVVIEDSRAAPTLRHVRVYSSPPTVEISHDGEDFIDTTDVYLVADRSSADIYYTLDGSVPGRKSTRHIAGPISIDTTTTVRAIAFDDSRKGMYPEQITLTRHDSATIKKPTLALDTPPTRTGVLKTTVRDIHSSLRNAVPQERFLPVLMNDGEIDILYDGFIRCRVDGMHVFHLPDNEHVRISIGSHTAENTLGTPTNLAIPMTPGWYPITVTWFDVQEDARCDIEWKSPNRSLRTLRGKDLGCNAE